MIDFQIRSDDVRNRVYVPKYYDPTIDRRLEALESQYRILSLRSLVDDGVLSVGTGDEIGKMAYGTGTIPFVRTSDLANWEIKATPKQGVSEEIYESYRARQDVQDADILLVRDGTYLIGTNCVVGALDRRILYQSHVLKIRIEKARVFPPQLLFILINTPIVQAQFRSIQFTADTLDTMGPRYLDVRVPVPRNRRRVARIVRQVQRLLRVRERGKAFIRNAPVLMETALAEDSVEPIEKFLALPWEKVIPGANQETTTAEFGQFDTYRISAAKIRHRIYIPKYYAPAIERELTALAATCDCVSVGELVDSGVLRADTGDEIGKMAYGTGSRPFVRTSDLANWEIKHDPKQGVSEGVFQEYSGRQDVAAGDVLLVRDGTYLVGASAIVTKHDPELIYCGGLYRLRVLDESVLDCWALLAILNSYVVKKQLRSKQFTRDVIDTIGRRLMEVVLPIPKSRRMRQQISEQVAQVVLSRGEARQGITRLAQTVVDETEL